jgi:hypothetical protein
MYLLLSLLTNVNIFFVTTILRRLSMNFWKSLKQVKSFLDINSIQWYKADNLIGVWNKTINIQIAEQYKRKYTLMKEESTEEGNNIFFVTTILRRLSMNFWKSLKQVKSFLIQILHLKFSRVRESLSKKKCFNLFLVLYLRSLVCTQK